MYLDRIQFRDSKTRFVPVVPYGVDGLGAGGSKTSVTDIEPTPIPNPLTFVVPPKAAPPLPVPSITPTATDATYAAPPLRSVTASLAESQLAQRIYNQHQKLKVLAKNRAVTADMAKRSQEFAKFLAAYLERYKATLRADVARNLANVIAETPGVVGGLSFIPLVIFGIALLASAFITYEVVSAVRKNLDVQEKEIDARLAVYTKGGASDVKDTFNKPTQAGLFGGLADFAKYAMVGGLVYIGWKMFSKKRRRAVA